MIRTPSIPRSVLLLPCTLLVLCTPPVSRPAPASESGSPETGTPFDAAPFGWLLEDDGGKARGIQWAEPRKVRRVLVSFEDGSKVPAPGKVRLQYWHRVWDGRPDPVLAEAGAGGVGWEAMDDWTNGDWKDADARLEAADTRWSYVFEPTGAKEFKGLRHPGVRYRKTLRIRLLSNEVLPASLRFRVFTDSVLRPLSVRILWGRPAEPKLPIGAEMDDGVLQVFNGSVRKLESSSEDEVRIRGENQWTLAAGAEGGMKAEIFMAAGASDSRYDRTVVTVRSKQRPFSFAADEIAAGGRILVDDLGVLVTRGDDAATVESFREARRELSGRAVYRRVFDEPEQTLYRAWNDMPLKRPLYFVHGLPGNRNAVRQDPNGDISITSSGHWFQRPASPKDSARKLWGGGALALSFGFPADNSRGGRLLLEGYLPCLRTWWQAGPIYYESRTILDKLDGNLNEIQGDDPTLLLMSLRLTNTSKRETGKASLRLASRPGDREKLRLDGPKAFAETKDGPRLRYLVDLGGRGTSAEDGEGVRWTLDLEPGQSHELCFWIPTITLESDEDIAAVRSRDFDKSAGRICEFWRRATERGARITTPELWLDGFYQAHARHLLVNCVREVGSDRLHAHVGTFSYGVFPDESAMMISDLDRRGYSKEAERCLESFLHYQGTAPMPGNFKSTEGLFYGSGGHDMGGYNKSHGWVMWVMAEHWRFTRDREWMERAAPKLVAACDWVARERLSTTREPAGGPRPLEHGFLPSGSLEDVTDYWHWLVTNACTVWGFESLAAALADFGHPEAGRLVAEAKAFRSDVMRGIEESRVLAPVVRLRDGTYVPKYPSRLHERGRSHGWLRETLEGSIHLLITGLLDPLSPQARWILEDYEDNLYISDRYGYSIPAFDRFWFSRGGFSMQANLLGGPLPYLYRDEIQHFLRAYFNSLSSAFYPDIRMCNEHSLPELGYPAGDHFKSSDEAQSTYWLRLMFVNEMGEDLYLGQAIPRTWLEDGRTVGIERGPSHFGELSFRIESKVSEGSMKATLRPPARNPPRRMYVRFRHPESKNLKSVTVDGKEHKDFDAAKEWVVLPGNLGREKAGKDVVITATY
jgi:hypothetical protein